MSVPISLLLLTSTPTSIIDTDSSAGTDSDGTSRFQCLDIGSFVPSLSVPALLSVSIINVGVDVRSRRDVGTDIDYPDPDLDSDSTSISDSGSGSGWDRDPGNR